MWEDFKSQNCSLGKSMLKAGCLRNEPDSDVLLLVTDYEISGVGLIFSSYEPDLAWCE